MEEQKYFTPNVEDFHKGYEYEILELHRENYHVGFNNIISKWIPKKWDSSQIRLNKLACKITSKEIRVPYLTKKQIENEGWALQEEFSNVYSIGFIKNLTYSGSNSVMFLLYNFASKWLLISIQSTIDNIYSIRYTDEKTNTNIGGNTLYAGKCKDINTLRYITKLLEV